MTLPLYLPKHGIKPIFTTTSISVVRDVSLNLIRDVLPVFSIHSTWNVFYWF